jgi:hypothetical protein
MPQSILHLAMASKSRTQSGIINALWKSGVGAGGEMLTMLPVKITKTLSPIFNKINNEGSLNTINFRPIGGAFNEGTVSIYQESTDIANVGGDIVIDEAFKFDEYVEGAKPEVLNVKQKTALIKRYMNDQSINGDKGINPYGYTGLRNLVTTNQTLNATDINSGYNNGLTVSTSATTQGDYLSLLDWLIEMVEGDTTKKALIMNNNAKRQLRKAARDKALYNQSQDAYQRTIDSYYGVPILNPGAKNGVEEYVLANNSTNAVLPNSRSYGSSNVATEIFCIRRDEEDGVTWLQPTGGDLKVRTVTEEAEAAPYKLIRLSWYLSLGVLSKNAAAMLKGVVAA